eukprot:1199514-Prymnesium_polylepis.1
MTSECIVCLSTSVRMSMSQARCGRAGVSGRRNEFLRSLTATIDDPQAARVMAEYDHFATTAANAGFPS